MELSFKEHPKFKPDLTPEEVFKRGAFGGTYFRKIYSSVVKKELESCHLEFEWAKKLPLNKLTNEVYDSSINQYPCYCGTSLEFWQQKNWIRPSAPRGWMQWYCRFYEGLRTEDDNRQINRWVRINRFKNQLVKTPTNKLKQTLLHWAYDPEKYTLK